jgi:hypothetical protein
LEEYRPNYLRYEAEAEGNALVVFSEIYTDKGWTVTIDGEQATPLRANYILRAVEVPAGKHNVEIIAYIPRTNGFKPLHDSDPTDPYQSPARWRTKGDSWSYEYNLTKEGVLVSPEVSEITAIEE